MAQYTYNKFNKWNTAPATAKKIAVYQGEKIIGYIPLGSLDTLSLRGAKLYRVGLLSDMHVDSQDQSNLANADRDYWVGDEADNDLKRSLNYFNQTLNVDLVCCAGDVGLSNPSDELTRWQTYIAETSPSTPVYTCTGNHDVYSGNYGGSTFKLYTRRANVEETAYAITESPTYQNSFCFTKTVNGKNDHFVFFSMYQNTPTDGNAYKQEDLEWVESMLKNFQNERTFLFTHYFFPAYAGNLGRVKGATQGGMYGTNKALGGNQTLENKFMQLLAKYPNVIWFSGHCHWKWNLQELQYNANIDRFKIGDSVNGVTYSPAWGQVGDEGAWTFHLSSNSSPLGNTTYSTSEYSSSVNQSGRPAGSECAYMDVYENGVEIVCIDMNTEDRTNGITDTRNMVILPIADYYLDTNLKQLYEVFLTQDDWTIGKNLSSTTGLPTTTNGTYAAISEYIKVVDGNKYLLTATNIVPEYDAAAGQTTEGINSICMYAYDENKNYLGRIKGTSFCPNGTANTLYYFDGENWLDDQGQDINKTQNVTSANIATITPYNDFEITENIFDNSNSVSGSPTYTGNVSYIRIRVQAVTALNSDSEIVANVLGNLESYVNIKEINLTGVAGGVEHETAPDTTYIVASQALQYSELAAMTTGQTKLIAWPSVARDAAQLGEANGAWSNSATYSGYTNYGASLSTTNAAANETKLQADTQINVNNSTSFIFKLTKVNGGFNIQGFDDNYLSTSATWTATPATLTISNATGTSASSTVVSQNNNPRLLRVSAGSNNLYYQNNGNPTFNTQTGGWTLYYMYEVTPYTETPDIPAEEIGAVVNNENVLEINDNALTPGTYTLKYEDEEGNAISGFGDIDKFTV